jgi:hypothetical protein
LVVSGSAAKAEPTESIENKLKTATNKDLNRLPGIPFPKFGAKIGLGGQKR